MCMTMLSAFHFITCTCLSHNIHSSNYHFSRASQEARLRSITHALEDLPVVATLPDSRASESEQLVLRVQPLCPERPHQARLLTYHKTALPYGQVASP